MLHSHQGYFKNDVRLFSDKNSAVKIPINKKITVMWEEEPIELKDTDKKIKDRLAIAESLKGILPPDADLRSAREERISRRGLTDQ